MTNFNNILSVEEAIQRHASHTPNKIAIIDEKGNPVSYKELDRNIQRAAHALFELGIKKGDRIILSASKSVDFIYLYFGAHLDGVITVPIDPEVNATRLTRIVETTEPEFIFGELRNAAGREVRTFDSIMSINMESETLNWPVPGNIADILFTTGTTGVPKGVTLTIANEYQAALNINQFIGNTNEDIELLALPVSHSFGLGRIRCVLVEGGTLVILGSFASMKKFYRAIEEFSVTGFGMVPASWSYISKMSGDRISEFADQLKYIEIGSAPMTMDEKKRLMRLLPNTKICMHYGLTEASRSAFISFHDEQEHLDSAGKASPNCEIAIFSEDGVRLGNGIEGEVCVKGKHVCSDYWNNHEEYLKDLYDGYFRTGDWGYLDLDGYLHLRSRRKEMINVGGKKVSPMEVEEALESIEGISEAACVGMPDPVMGEVVVAFVKDAMNDEKEKDIITRIATMLENYKVPVAIRHVDNIPKTSSGKLQRLKLKEEFYG